MARSANALKKTKLSILILQNILFATQNFIRGTQLKTVLFSRLFGEQPKQVNQLILQLLKKQWLFNS